MKLSSSCTTNANNISCQIDGDIVGQYPLRDRMYIGGSAKLERCMIEQFPSGVIVKNSLEIHGFDKITVFPKDIAVYGDIHLKFCLNLREIEPGIEIQKSLIINWCKNFTTLPENLHIPGNLVIFGCKSFSSLPNGLTVDGTFYTDKMSLSLNGEIKLGGFKKYND